MNKKTTAAASALTLSIAGLAASSALTAADFVRGQLGAISPALGSVEVAGITAFVGRSVATELASANNAGALEVALQLLPGDDGILRGTVVSANPLRSSLISIPEATASSAAASSESFSTAGIVGTGVQGIVGTGVQGIVGTGVQGIVGTGVQGIVGTGVQGIVGTGVQGIVGTGVQGIVGTGVQGIVGTGVN
jgi:hypothetical protein